MPISEPIYQGIVDRHMLEALDEAWDIACEHGEHDDPEFATEHGGPATHWAITPCKSGFRCAPLVAHVRSMAELASRYTCRGCGKVHAWADNAFIPIAGAS